MKSMFHNSTALAALLCAGLAVPVIAQDQISQSGELSASDEQLDSGEYFDLYRFEGRQGDVVDVRLTSSDFDAFLALVGPEEFIVQNDDEEDGDSTNARIREVLPATGTYSIMMTSYEAGETGSYRLTGTVGAGGGGNSQSRARGNNGSNGANNRASNASGGEPVAVVTRYGDLEDGDAQLSSGEFYDAYRFNGQAGQRVVVRATSSEFDTYLLLRGPGDFSEENDDFEEGDTNAGLVVTLPETGEYRVSVTSFEPGETGSYSVAAEGVLISAAPSTGGAPPLAVGTPVSGDLATGDRQLENGEYYDVFTLRGEPGAQYVVRMDSREFDTYLAAVGEGDYEVENDDDPAGNRGTNSRLDVTIPETGTLAIAATSYAGEETGRYTLVAELAGASARPASASAEAIALGDNRRGTLAATDPRGESSREDVYVIEASAGQTIRLALSSDAFDPLLRIEGPGGFRAENDDDPSGDTLNSLLETRLPSAGTYRIVVASYAEDGLGSYQLATSTAGSGAAASTAGGSIASLAVGERVNGSLSSSDNAISSGAYFDAYSFTGRRGQRVTFDLTSPDFDTYLSLLFPGGGSEANDDRGGGTEGTDSRLTVVLPEDGTYQVVATSYQGGETGSYTLSSSVASSSSASAAPVRPRGAATTRVFALSVGVADYGGRAGNLSLTDQDATKLNQTLEAQGMLADGSVLLVNRQATRANFIQAIEDISAVIGPDDLLLIFFSGHGSKAPAERFMERDGTSETIEMYDASIKDYELAQMLDPVRARILLVLDSCFSGGFDDVINRSTGRMGVFSSDSDLTSLVASKFQAGGYISHILQQAVEGRADDNGDGEITAGELSEYMRTAFYRIALDEPLRTTAYNSGGTRSQGYQHIVVNRGGDGMPYDAVLLSIGASTASADQPFDAPLLAFAE